MSRRQEDNRGTGVMPVLSLVFVLIVASQAGARVVQPKIVGGSEAEKGEFPFMVSFMFTAENTKIHRCGGSIIDEYHIITAAHCIHNQMAENPNYKMAVRLGCHNFTECNNAYEIAEHFVHPDFETAEYGNRANDIAILKTVERIEFTGPIGAGAIGPIELPEGDDSIDGELLTIAGWGNISSSAEPDVLMKANVTVIEWEECSYEFPEVDETLMCAGAESKDSCSGDSGGPLFRRNGPNKTATLIGIVAYGPKECLGPIGVYTRVASFLDWIEDIISLPSW